MSPFCGALTAYNKTFSPKTQKATRKARKARYADGIVWAHEKKAGRGPSLRYAIDTAVFTPFTLFFQDSPYI